MNKQLDHFVSTTYPISTLRLLFSGCGYLYLKKYFEHSCFTEAYIAKLHMI